jgi:RimJ/RimL family protein N-acetyltransferase
MRKQPILTGDRTTLRPMKDVEYLVGLASSDNKADTSAYSRKLVASNGGEFWDIFVKEEKKGVVGYFVINGVFVLEALIDHTVKPLGMICAIEAGNMVMVYLFKKTERIRTFARQENRVVQRLCLKLGFVEIARIEDNKEKYIIYEKEK